MIFISPGARTRELNPMVPQSVITRAFNRDSLSARVEYDAEFADPVAAFLDGEVIARAVDRGRCQADRAMAGMTYRAAIDPATMSDRYAFVICHKEDENIIMDYSHILKPPVDPKVAEDLLADLVRRFHPVKVYCDTSSTALRLKGVIPGMEYKPFTRPLKLQIYGNLKEALNLEHLILYPDDDLLDELKALQITNGVDIHAPKAGRVTHDDLSDCLALVVDGFTTGSAGHLVDPDKLGMVHPSRWLGGEVSKGNIEIFGEDSRYPTQEFEYHGPKVGGRWAGKSFDND